MLAVDRRNRLWAAVGGSRIGDAKYHYRPCIIRLVDNFLDPSVNGVTSRSTRLLGLHLAATCSLPQNASTKLEPTSIDFVVQPGDRQINNLDVSWVVYDLWKHPVAQGRFRFRLKTGSRSQHAVTFTPPKWGWYDVQFAASQGGQPLMGVSTNVGFTPAYPGMPDSPGLVKQTWIDPQRQAFCGLPLMRLGVNQGLDVMDQAVDQAAKYGNVVFGQFTDKKDCTPQTVTAAVTRFKGRIGIWEVMNEPNFSMSPQNYVKLIKELYPIIKRIDPSAKVMGPDVCGIDLNWYKAFYRAGGKNFVDILSVHDYEGNESIDPGHWCWKVGELKKVMAKYGDSAKPIWQTELAIGAVRAKDFIPGVQAARILLQRDILETLGIPSEHNNFYYLNQGGYSAVPTYIWSDDGPFPAALATRTRAAMIAGRVYAGSLDFGPTGNKLFMGLRYTSDDGSTITLRNYGSDVLTPRLDVTGGQTVDVVDAFGNEQFVPVDNGHITLSLSTLPVYLRLGKGQEVSVPPIDFGQNLAPLATIQYSAATKSDPSMLTNGILPAAFPSDPHQNYWTGDLPDVPQYLTFRFAQPEQISHLIVYTVRADNPYCTLLDYDVQVLDGTNWKTIQRVRTPCPPSDAIQNDETLATSWYLDENFIVNAFPTITTPALRLVVLRTTHGFITDGIAEAACSFQANSPHLMLRQVEIYGPSPAVAK